MKAEKLIDAIGEVRDEYVLDAETSERRKWRVWPALTAAAACLAVIIGTLAWSGVLRGRGDYALSARSENARVFDLTRPLKGAPRSAYDLIWLPEEEMFTHWDTAIFRGTVTDIQNIEVDMNGESFYWSLVSVEVSHVLRGDVEPGETVRIRVETPIGGEIWVEDQDLAAQLRVGMEGVFMPQVYDDESMFGAYGAWLCLRDLSPYGLADGVRWLFLQTPEGLAYDRATFASASGAKTLEDIEAYIVRMLEKTA